ncbi:hypothetical protein IPF37_04290 [bacterium]|nr:MAG: hypothetical protein IPF37_04290 [bacterium]
MVQELLQCPEVTTGSFCGFGTKSINYADKDGNTALIRAIQKVQTSYVAGDKRGHKACVDSQKIIDILLNTPGIDPHHANKKGETAIALLEKLNKKYN